MLEKDLPWVVLSIANEMYAISCKNIISLYRLMDIIKLPNAPEEIRGMTKFRDKVIELIDIRAILGFKTIDVEITEFNDLMSARLNDHVNWLEKLNKIVMEDLPFDLETNPHKCAFGKWYDSYDVANASIMFQSAFGKFDKPHRQIHEIAIKAEQFIKIGEKQAAIDLIQKTKDNELKQMVVLFDEIKSAFQDAKREIVTVLGNDSKYICMAVDEVLSIEHLNDFEEDLIKESITDSEYLMGIAKRKSGSALVLLNDDFIMSKF